ncbi:MAG: hypothetical protein Q9167_002880 [Letrouitia subvulpina]
MYIDEMKKLKRALKSTKSRLRALFTRQDDFKEPVPNPAGQMKMRSFSRIEQLPPEIIQNIAGHLTLDSWACLMCTSYYFRCFFFGLNFSMNDFKGSGAPMYYGNPKEIENFKALLERDNPPDVTDPTTKVYCSKCRMRISIKHFRRDPFEYDRRKRQCIGHEGKIWYCPHGWLDYAELQRYTWRFDRRDMVEGKCSDCPQRVLLNRHCPCYTCMNSAIWDLTPSSSPPASLLIARPVLNIPDERIVTTKRQLMDAMRRRALPICPHLRMNSPCVMAQFDLERIPPGQEISKHGVICFSQKGKCDRCHTSFFFALYENKVRMREGRKPKYMVALCIRHHFEHATGPNRGGWLSMITKPSGEAKLKRQWKADLSATQRQGLPQRGGEWGRRWGPVSSIEA